MIDPSNDDVSARFTSELLQEAGRLLALLNDDRHNPHFECLRMARDECATKLLRVEQVAIAEERASADLSAALDRLASTIAHLQQARNRS